MRLFASRDKLEKWGKLARSCSSLVKQTSMPSSSFRMVHTHSSLVGRVPCGAEVSCCRASFRASSLHSKHCCKSSSFSSAFCNVHKPCQPTGDATLLVGVPASDLQQNQLSGPLRRRAHELQSLAAADVVQSGLQQAHHGVKVRRFKETLDLLQRLTALQRLEALLHLSRARGRAASFPNHIQRLYTTFMYREADCSHVLTMAYASARYVRRHRRC